jgi:hypothetical protein
MTSDERLARHRRKSAAILCDLAKVTDDVRLCADIMAFADQSDASAAELEKVAAPVGASPSSGGE